MTSRTRSTGSHARSRLGASPAVPERGVGSQLRDSLTRHALRLVEEHGPDGLTLRAVARAAEASHNAPYIYFPGGVIELLAVVAIHGFEAFIAALEHSPVKSDPVERTHEVVRRYVRFGVERPQLYRAMFHARLADSLENPDDSTLPAARAPETFLTLRMLKVEAYELLVAPLFALESKGSLRAGNPREFGLAVAALAHGLVGEFIDEGLEGRASRLQPWSKPRREMTAAITDMLLHGLLATPARL